MSGESRLIDELNLLRRRVSELEPLEARYHEAETALDQADRRWNDLLEVVGDSVFIIDMNRIILDVNSHAARRLGYSREELLALPYAAIEILEQRTSSAWESEFSRTRFYEAIHRHKDGIELPVEVSSRVIKHKDQPAMLNFARSITHRKQIEADREQLIAELDAYAHTVAHDLKGPVGIILGYGDMLLNSFPGLEEEKIPEIAQRIVQGARTMQSIINELLLLANLRNTDEVSMHPLTMAEIVGAALERLEVTTAESGTMITLPDDWPPALGYAPWIEEIWVNYISNGIKYGGQPPMLELGATSEGDRVAFWVRDNGPGISAEDQGSLFQPFNRLDPTRAQGHGLGLSIVKSIAAKLGGEAGVRSTPSEGSTFYFTLPHQGNSRPSH